MNTPREMCNPGKQACVCTCTYTGSQYTHYIVCVHVKNTCTNTDLGERDVEESFGYHIVVIFCIFEVPLANALELQVV